MIKLIKLNEPQILTDNYTRWTEILIEHQEEEELKNKKIPHYVKKKYSHSNIKTILKEETCGKCAYCESKILHISFGDIEHIIPKTYDTHMWFKWSNLTLGCQICNNNKSNYYDESNPLIDPYIDEIDEHILFIGSVLFSKTDKGYTTISTLELNRADLLDARNYYLNTTINPFLQLIAVQPNPILKLKLLEDSFKFADKSHEFSKMSLEAITQFALSAGLAS